MIFTKFQLFIEARLSDVLNIKGDGDLVKQMTKIKDAEFDVELPLVKWKTTKADVLNWWKQQPFDLQVNEPYGNCDGCFLKGKGKLAIIAKEKPELFDWWIKHETETGSTFKKEIT